LEGGERARDGGRRSGRSDLQNANGTRESEVSSKGVMTPCTSGEEKGRMTGGEGKSWGISLVRVAAFGIRDNHPSLERWFAHVALGKLKGRAVTILRRNDDKKEKGEGDTTGDVEKKPLQSMEFRVG